jgi:hypothetical protein
MFEDDDEGELRSCLFPGWKGYLGAAGLCGHGGSGSTLPVSKNEILEWNGRSPSLGSVAAGPVGSNLVAPERSSQLEDESRRS